ncbi:MAG: hypothetical protein AB1938_31165 [Myxococcota bacterium]
MRAFLRALLVVLSLALAACGAPSAGSCFNLPWVCTEYVGSGYTWGQVQSSCKGPASQSTCPSANRVGRCRMWSGLPTEVIFHYYAPEEDEASARVQCNTGEWLGP